MACHLKEKLSKVLNFVCENHVGECEEIDDRDSAGAEEGRRRGAAF